MTVFTVTGIDCAAAASSRGQAKEQVSMKKAKKSARRKGHAVTIDAVAARAKVSPMTVSRVVNGHGKVREATRERVSRAVLELGYTPNLAASSLAAARGTRIALIYTNPSSAYLSELLVGALRGAARTAAQLVIESWGDVNTESERKAARALASSVAGAILPPPLCESKAVISETARRRRPRRGDRPRDDRATTSRTCASMISARPRRSPSTSSRMATPHRLHQGPSEPDRERAPLRRIQGRARRSRDSISMTRWSNRATSLTAPA
jgi:hypothetical protein